MARHIADWLGCLSMSDTVSAGIDSPNVSKWLEANVEGAKGPFNFEFIAGGHSNLTFSVVVLDSYHRDFRPFVTTALSVVFCTWRID